MPNTLLSPCAPHGALKAGELAPGLPAHMDPTGALLDLQDYRRWLDRQPAAVPASTAVPDELQDGQGVRACPSCGRLMQRLRSGSERGFRLDRCAPCQLVWLDAGEWEALSAEGQATQLLALLSDAGQRQIQREEARERREAELRQRHGEEALAELQRVRGWLANRADREDLLTLLRNGW